MMTCKGEEYVMKLGIITDIHNNVFALQAVLGRLQEAGCEQIVCCGDIVGIGPFPEETVQCMMRLPHLVAVRGNHERYLLEGMPDHVPNEEGMGYEEMEQHRWERRQLSEASMHFLEKLPYDACLTLEGKRIMVLHYAMDTQHRYIHYVPHPDAAALSHVFSGIHADAVLYGHDHTRCVCQTQGTLYVNSGALGCPAPDHNVARAGILTLANGTLSFTPLEVPYPVEEVLAAIDRLQYPAADEIKSIFF